MQKTAYEMRISDWSSDVCSSYLAERPDGRRPPGERRGPGLHAQLGDRVDRNRQDMGRQAAAVTPERLDQRFAVIEVVEQDDRPAAPRLPVGEEERAQPQQQRLRARQVVGGGSGRTGGGAAAAPGADMRVDRDMVARRRDGARRTEVETERTAGDGRPRRGAEETGREH